MENRDIEEEKYHNEEILSVIQTDGGMKKSASNANFVKN